MEEAPDRPTPPGLSRRNLLRRAAIAGGTAWALPVVQSINTSRALAASPLEVCYTLKFESDGRCTQAGGRHDCIRSPLQDGCGLGATVVMNADGTWTVILPPGRTCRFVSGFSKCDGPEVPCVPGLDNGDGTMTFFECPKLDGSGFHEISHISLEVCCT